MGARNRADDMAAHRMTAHRVAGRPARLLTGQRGVSLIGLIFSLAMLGLGLMLGFKILPTYIEYRAISTAIVAAKANGGTAREIRSAFDKHASASYITSISGRDLVIDSDGGQIDVSFAYQKKIALVGPASLVLDYAGSTGAAAKPAR
jgi:N-methylhydantoinase A/oxoprolinase/acetone carboxylase beta subunit